MRFYSKDNDSVLIHELCSGFRVYACGIFGIHKHSGSAAAEMYESLLMLQHRGQDSAGMVTYDGSRFREHKARCKSFRVSTNSNSLLPPGQWPREGVWAPDTECS